MRRNWILILFILISVFAQVRVAESAAKTLVFVWEQDTSDLDHLKEWRLRAADTPGGPYDIVTVIPFNGTPQAEYTSSQPISLVPDGQRKWVYFVMTAVATSNIESGYSNEVGVLIDLTVVTTPLRLRVVIE